MKHIGIVGCSAEGAALCYRTICLESQEKLGEHNHPEITMHTHPLAEYMVHITAGNWEKVGELMLSSTEKIALAGADFAISPDNTIHEAFSRVKNQSPLPWIHIADAVAAEARSRGFKKIGITGTKYLMNGPVYPDTFEKYNLSYEIPDSNDREEIDRIIFTELTKGTFPEKSRIYFNHVFQKLKVIGCDAAVLGCTEIPLLVNPDDCPLPTLDSTRLLARAAIKEAIS